MGEYVTSEEYRLIEVHRETQLFLPGRSIQYLSVEVKSASSRMFSHFS